MNDATEIVLRHLSVVQLRPGDTLVFLHPGRLSNQTKAHIAETVRRLGTESGIPDLRRLVVEDGADLAILRKLPSDTP